LVLIDAIGVVFLLFQEHPLATALLVVVLEIPRYSVAIVAVGINSLRRPEPRTAHQHRVSAIVPVFNGASDAIPAIESLLAQSPSIDEIIVVDDGSDPANQTILADFSQGQDKVHLIRHRQRAGKSASINHAAQLAKGELLLTIDNDTQLDPHACWRLAQAFNDPSVAAVCANLLVSNRRRNPLTSLQSLEYLLSIGIGKRFLSHIKAISCCSGALSMYRADTFQAVGGLNVGPGEDLEITLRLRQAGFNVEFVDNAYGDTAVPQTISGLFKQRLRWDGDALMIRMLMYREWSFKKPAERLGHTLQRLDYIFLELIPTLVFPFYLVYLWINFGTGFINILSAFYVLLFWLYALNILLGIVISKRTLSALDILVLPVMPLYQGIIMRLVRFVAISDELLLARSRHDPYVPRHVRHALYRKVDD
jgi:cellulose synthase/poly-beta-1,6-N-acetylglucosamine synthase-like glycosyltransferase